MDIKSFPTDLYHKYKYLIIFLDDFTSMAWTILLCTKSAAIMATCQFLQMVKMQFQASVQGWMSDFGGEYKSAAYNNLLKGEFTTLPPTCHNKMDVQNNSCTL